MKASDRYKIALNVLAMHGMDSDQLQKEFARAVSMFDSVDDIADIKTNMGQMGAMGGNLPPQGANQPVSEPMGGNMPQSTALGGNTPQMP